MRSAHDGLAALNRTFLVAIALILSWTQTGAYQSTDAHPFLFHVNQRYGFVDGNLKINDSPSLLSRKGFHDELAAVLTRKGWGFIDSTGQMVIPPEFRDAKSFNHGFAAVTEDERWWRFLNKQGEYISGQKFWDMRHPILVL